MRKKAGREADQDFSPRGSSNLTPLSERRLLRKDSDLVVSRLEFRWRQSHNAPLAIEARPITGSGFEASIEIDRRPMEWPIDRTVSPTITRRVVSGFGKVAHRDLSGLRMGRDGQLSNSRRASS
jgi:hypothetical protein